MGAWATTYLGDQGFGKRAASGLLSGFWLAFMAARLVTALLVTVLGLPAEARPVLILALALVSVVVLAVVVTLAGLQRRSSQSREGVLPVRLPG